MSEQYNFDLKRIDQEGNEFLSPHRAVFNSGTLTISMVEVDDQGTEKLTPTMIQPFKTLPDGSRTDFADADDAFAWVDSMIGVILN